MYAVVDVKTGKKVRTVRPPDLDDARRGFWLYGDSRQAPSIVKTASGKVLLFGGSIHVSDPTTGTYEKTVAVPVCEGAGT